MRRGLSGDRQAVDARVFGRATLKGDTGGEEQAVKPSEAAIHLSRQQDQA